MLKIKIPNSLPSSFRDPSGFLFFDGYELYRYISNSYSVHYDHFMSSGLCESLVRDGYLIKHEEIFDKSRFVNLKHTDDCYKIIKPDLIPFISYPYEWCFSQLKDAALLVLTIQLRAIKYGMILKDATAYNVQFLKNKPIFIDTLSFEKLEEGKPWAAYRQFCQHFLAPLFLMASTDVRLNQLSRIYIDGIPLDLADKLLPLRAHFNLAAFLNIHLHAKFQKSSEKHAGKGKDKRVSLLGLRGIIENLQKSITALNWNPSGTVWADYYTDTNYSDQSLLVKGAILKDYTEQIKPQTVWDLGANNGFFSRIATTQEALTISMDFDPAAVEQNYRFCKKENNSFMHPLVVDLTNPSGGIGWHNQERNSLAARGPCDLGFALALIHHLAIGNNVPFPEISRFFAEICKALIIEFVPKDDSQVQRLLADRKDIFTDYHEDAFVKAFSQHFEIVKSHGIKGSKRILYLMTKKP